MDLNKQGIEPTNQRMHIHQNIREQCHLSNLWAQQHREVLNTVDFKTNSMPLSRLKRMMKRNESVKMVSTDACIVFAKACEFFIKELTMRSWVHSEENMRRILNRGDIANAIARVDCFDFLKDVVPLDDTMEHNVYTGLNRASGSVESVRIAPNYQATPLPPRNVLGPPYGHPRLIMGRGVPNQACVGNIVTHSMTTLDWSQQQQNNAPPDINRASGSAASVRIAPNYQPMSLPSMNILGSPYGHPRLIMGRGIPNQAHVGNIVTHSMPALEWPQQQQNDAPPSSDQI